QGVIVRSCPRVEGAGSGQVFTLLPRGDAGDEIDKLSKVSALQREAADRGSGDHLAELGALRFHQRDGRGDGDGLRNLCQVKTKINDLLLVYLQDDVVVERRLESPLLDRHRIGSRNQKGHI